MRTMEELSEKMSYDLWRAMRCLDDDEWLDYSILVVRDDRTVDEGYEQVERGQEAAS